ncbi:MAG TPA: SGNH family hydrolase [Xanthobacteraceae bacterium]
MLGLNAAVIAPTSAQVFDDRFPFIEEWTRRGGASPGDTSRQGQAPYVENNNKAPPPTRKADAAPLTSVVVLGDSMADWLAYGLEQAAAESPDIGILRRHRTLSGLIRADVKNDPRGEYPDWPQAAREILNAEKPNFIVMMIGLNDRRPIKEKAPAKTAGTPAAPAAATAPAPSAAPADAEAATDEPPAEPPVAAAEPEPATPGMVTYEFRSDKWTESYIRRIDDTIAALKSKNVPVLWVGLPPIRNTKASADLSYLNDLFRSRAEKAGITYIDTWDGFVDEAGRFVMQGPDFEGQIRRLRSGDGTHFTQAGARKLAHYVEREIQRGLMAHATPVALPPEEPVPQQPVARPGNAAIPRPLAGPVMPLTTAAEEDELVGGASARQVTVDPIAARVLVRGEQTSAPAGRADDFAWPRRSVAPLGTDPVVATTTTPMTPMQTGQRQAAAAPGVEPAAAAGSAAAPGAGAAPRARPAGPPRQAAAAPGVPRPPGFVGQQRPDPRRVAPAPQPFFFPFFGR